jgi:hypothetical protein
VLADFGRRSVHYEALGRRARRCKFSAAQINLFGAAAEHHARACWPGTSAPELFNGNHRTVGGPRMVSDVLVHEMVYAT